MKSEYEKRSLLWYDCVLLSTMSLTVLIVVCTSTVHKFNTLTKLTDSNEVSSGNSTISSEAKGRSCSNMARFCFSFLVVFSVAVEERFFHRCSLDTVASGISVVLVQGNTLGTAFLLRR